MSRERKLNQTVLVFRAAPARSSAGVVTSARPSAATSSTRGRLLAGKGATAQSDQGAFYEATAELLLPADADVRPMAAGAAGGQGDWVSVDGAVYRVLSVQSPAGRGRFLKALLAREA
ncbi:MAG TPA: hypothetical protein P5137_01000 [Candidatus Brocadiia bacterium]|nr:hypothetical protein [Candidatus Brocadiia bacterium]